MCCRPPVSDYCLRIPSCGPGGRQYPHQQPQGTTVVYLHDTCWLSDGQTVPLCSYSALKYVIDILQNDYRPGNVHERMIKMSGMNKLEGLSYNLTQIIIPFYCTDDHFCCYAYKWRVNPAVSFYSLRHISAAYCNSYSGKMQGKSSETIIREDTEYKRGKRKELVDGFLICSFLPALASLKLHCVMHEQEAANIMT